MCDVDVVVFVHRDLLDHDAAFRINVGRIDSSSGDHVPEDIDRERHVIGQDARVVTRAFLGGKCIEVAANLFDFGGNFEWPSSGGPLKEEMFKKMGCPSCFAGFVSRTNADQKPSATERAPGTNSETTLVHQENGPLHQRSISPGQQRAG